MLATQAILLSLRGTHLIQSKAALGAGEQRVNSASTSWACRSTSSPLSGVILLIGALASPARASSSASTSSGGTRIQAALEQAATVEQVRDASRRGLRRREVQTLENADIGENVVQISTEELPRAASTRRPTSSTRSSASPTRRTRQSARRFGESIANSAIVAIIASLLVIAVYIALRFQWKFAVPVLIALMHDILITAGVYALVGREVTASTVAALLTILGFSLYDTIIVFDRIRENIPRMPSATFSQIVNRSMSEVIVRSLATSFCTVLPVFGLLLFGGETLKDFAFALLIGTCRAPTRPSSSPAPVLAAWKEREPIYKARTARILAEHGDVPGYADRRRGRPVDVAPKERRPP